MSTEFTGKVVLVTAAASGIGAATAVAFAEAGARLMLADFNEEGLAATAAAARNAGAEVATMVCDCTDDAQVKALVETAVSTYGRIDIGANIVGGALGDAAGPQFHLQSTQGWNDTLALTLNSSYMCMKYEVAEMLKHGGGSIVNIGSLAGLSYVADGGIAYAAGKAAVIHMTKFAALAYADQGVRVNCIAPGTTETPAIAAMAANDAEFTNRMVSSQAIKRFIKPSEQAAAILWLCSDAAAMVTGHTLQVDGGWLS